MIVLPKFYTECASKRIFCKDIDKNFLACFLTYSIVCINNM